MRTRNPPDHPDEGAAGWSLTVDEGLAAELSDIRVQVELLRDHLAMFSGHLREAEGQDKLGNVEINALLSDYNQAETLSSSVQKKVSDVVACIISKI